MKMTLFCLPRVLVVATAATSVYVFSAAGQTATSATLTPGSSATAKNIGSAPANSAQHQILTGALSPETRQTLQDAMNSYSEADATHQAAAK